MGRTDSSRCESKNRVEHSCNFQQRINVRFYLVACSMITAGGPAEQKTVFAALVLGTVLFSSRRWHTSIRSFSENIFPALIEKC